MSALGHSSRSMISIGASIFVCRRLPPWWAKCCAVRRWRSVDCARARSSSSSCAPGGRPRPESRRGARGAGRSTGEVLLLTFGTRGTFLSRSFARLRRTLTSMASSGETAVMVSTAPLACAPGGRPGELRRVLKPDGQLITIEHVRARSDLSEFSWIL